jgi:hypothetical protein
VCNVPYFIQISCQVRAGRALFPLTDTRPRLISVILSQHSCKMAALAERWSNIELCNVIRFLRLKGTPPAEIHRQLVDVYGANVMLQKHFWVWCTAFDNDRTARVSCYGATIGRYWTILPTALTWHRVIFISLDH